MCTIVFGVRFLFTRSWPHNGRGRPHQTVLFLAQSFPDLRIACAVLLAEECGGTGGRGLARKAGDGGAAQLKQPATTTCIQRTGLTMCRLVGKN